MHYMGDRRTGCQLLRDAPADADAPLSPPSHPPGGAEPAHRPGPDAAWGGGGGGYVRACGGRGLLYGMAAAVERLTGVLASAEPEGLGPESWARAVRDFSKWP